MDTEGSNTQTQIDDDDHHRVERVGSKEEIHDRHLHGKENEEKHRERRRKKVSHMHENLVGKKVGPLKMKYVFDEMQECFDGIGIFPFLRVKVAQVESEVTYASMPHTVGIERKVLKMIINNFGKELEEMEKEFSKVIEQQWKAAVAILDDDESGFPAGIIEKNKGRVKGTVKFVPDLLVKGASLGTMSLSHKYQVA